MTVTIEIGDDITTISVPLSSKVVMSTEDSFYGQKLTFSCLALYDIDRNQYYSLSNKPRDPDNLGDHIVLGED